MTLAEIRIRVKNICSGKNYMGVAEDSHINAQINEALRYVGFMAPQYSISTLVTVSTGVGQYLLSDLDKTMMTVDTVSVNGMMLRGYTGKLGAMYSWAEFKAYYPNLGGTNLGKPEAACTYGKFLFLAPAPDQNYEVTAFGRYLPEALATDSDEPDLPLHLHECVAVLAAILAMYPVRGTDDLLAKLKDEYSICYEVLKKEMELDATRGIAGFATQNAGGTI